MSSNNTIQSLIIKYKKEIIIALSGIIYLICKLSIRNNQVLLSNIVNSKVRTVKEFIENMYDDNKYIIIDGVLSNNDNNQMYVDLNYPLKIQSTNLNKNAISKLVSKYIFTGNKDKFITINCNNSQQFNLRSGNIEKNNFVLNYLFNPNFMLSALIRYKFYFNRNFSFTLLTESNIPLVLGELRTLKYLLFNDKLQIFGIKEKIDKEVFFKSKILVQGNKPTLIKIIKNKIANLSYTSKLFGLIFISGVLSYGLNEILKYLENYYRKYNVISKRQARRFKENCVKCGYQYANVILRNCNHFNLCYECFLSENKKCRICQEEDSDYILLNDKNFS